MPSSTSFGARFNCSTMTRYSSVVSATSLSRRSWLTATGRAPPGAVRFRPSRHQGLDCFFGQRAKQLQAVGAAELGFRAPLWMRHHPEHVSARVDDAGDAVEGSVWVGARDHAAVLVAVAEHDLAALLEPRQGRRVREVVAFAV